MEHKMFNLCLLFFICNISIGYCITVTEVKAGHLAELPCLSSDDNHRFMFWQLSDDHDIIGPGNPIDEDKYNYEVLTGKLLIRGVSTKEAGFYKCVSKGVEDHAAINVHVVELVVRKEWDIPSENAFEKNLLRGMTGVMVIVVGIAVVLLIMIMKKKKNRTFFDLEESRDGSPAKYRPDQVQPKPGPSKIESVGIDNAGLDVDFPQVFTHMQTNQGLSH